jgi:CRP/FNR family transcriptional regulator, cyclic AMP receptor protein
MQIGALGKSYSDGELIARQGEVGECMYIIQKGKVEVFVENPEGTVVLATLKTGAIFGEMALFTREPRVASVRACGKARVMTIDKRGFFKRVHEDPSLAFRILQKMSKRIQKLDDELARLKNAK